ncbi:hypothetical protein TNCV_1985651 [Trichonephila clavipes]|nr:hypothetical protein TNCV_1985651 [Trichonephila clavipes]
MSTVRRLCGVCGGTEALVESTICQGKWEARDFYPEFSLSLHEVRSFSSSLSASEILFSSCRKPSLTSSPCVNRRVCFSKRLDSSGSHLRQYSPLT